MPEQPAARWPWHWCSIAPFSPGDKMQMAGCDISSPATTQGAGGGCLLGTWQAHEANPQWIHPQSFLKVTNWSPAGVAMCRERDHRLGCLLGDLPQTSAGTENQDSVVIEHQGSTTSSWGRGLVPSQ